jgi:DNA invertase Pin-like site-specific DNA recombinase
MGRPGQKIGYRRVSTAGQTTVRQLDGIPLDRVFEDKASGKDMDRPQLEELLKFVREGDTVVVHSMDRLARNLDDLRRLVQTLTKRGIRIEFVKECLTFSGDDTPMANLLLSVMGAFAEFERALLRERQAEGIAKAKEAGIYKGRKPKLTDDQAADIRRRVKAGENKAALAREYGIDRSTLYGYIQPSKPEPKKKRTPRPALVPAPDWAIPSLETVTPKGKK